MKLNLKGVTNATWARIVALFLVFVNLVANTFWGFELLPFSDEQINTGASVAVAVIVGTITSWKNNSLTKPAQNADKVLKNNKK